MTQLYRRADAYVSLHRAEGFGMCLAEAMAAGLPVVATGYSGNLDFMDDASAFLVRHRMVAIGEKLAHAKFYELGMEWADPSEDDAIEQLRACVDDTARRRRVANAGRARAAEQLSLRAVGSRMKALLDR